MTAPGASYTPQAEPPAPEARDTFLAHFPTNKRSTAANWLLEPIRALNATTPQFVVTCVLGQLRKRLDSHWCTGQARADAEYAIAMIEAHRNEALVAAAYYITYSQLPEAEREKVKERQREQGRTAYMAQRPPSQKQIAYLQNLGYQGEPPASMHEASAAIDRILAGRRKVTQR